MLTCRTGSRWAIRLVELLLSFGQFLLKRFCWTVQNECKELVTCLRENNQMRTNLICKPAGRLACVVSIAAEYG